MCSNNVLGNNMNSFNNPNMLNGNVGLVIENGNSSVLNTNTTPFNNGDVLSTTNINPGNFNNNFNNSYGSNCNNNNSCNCNGNNSCTCNSNNNNTCGCNCNGNNSNDNNSCGCGGNNNDSDSITNNNLQRNLRNFIGRRVTLEFNNCGTCSKKTGVLTCVGCNFVTLRGVNNNNCLIADTAGLIFVTVHNCQC